MNKSLELTAEEAEILATQLACRCDQLDVYIREKAAKGGNFDDTYELKKKLQNIMERLYKLY